MQISGLTQYQVEMLDIMWDLEDLEDYEQWYSLLDKSDQKLADVLQRMLILESMEEVLGDMQEAKEVISRFT